MTAIEKYKNINEQQVKLWAEIYCKDASPAEIKLFLNLCDKTGMSPEARQIYMIDRWDPKKQGYVKTPMFSIEAFRLIAERSHKYAGQVGAWWCGADGVWKDVWLDKNPPYAAKVGVLRADFKEPLYAVATYGSYCQTNKKDGSPTQTWSKMPDVMLAKCAESLALRKAFSQDLSGLYTREEMQALPDNEIIEPEVVSETTQIANSDHGIAAKKEKKQSAKSTVAGASVDSPSAHVKESSPPLEIYSHGNQEQQDRLEKILEKRDLPKELYLTISETMNGKPMTLAQVENVIRQVPIA